MCGITGFVNTRLTHEEKENIIKKMSDRIKHRGPDGEGYYVDEMIALGHRRLSIIDLKTGDQPMYSNDKKLVIVFNGEIYNYKELKKELKYDFKTTSDTEVLLAGYKKWGKDLPKHLRGMFAFCIYDIRKKQVFIARDHFGIKPLYYYKTRNTFMFASEIKSFLEHPDFKREFNESILSNYMSFSFTPTRETFFKGVRRLDAGTSLFIDVTGKIKIEKYTHEEFNIEKNDYKEEVKNISDIMKDSVEHHMIADVEVGSFLSGGVDSSYIVALAKPDKTYTVGYNEARYSEIDNAKDLAKKLHMKNKSKIITKKEYMKAIDKVLYHMDEPSSDPAIVSLYFVAELASRDVKVVLSGEGSDEFFGGYNIYRQDVDMALYNKIPFFIRHLISTILKPFPPFRGRNFLVRRGERLEYSYIGVSRVFEESEIKRLSKVPITIKNKDVTKEVYDEYKDESNLIKMQAIDINYWLVKDILQKADRMTMAHSLEGRVPFTDRCVFDVASRLPLDYKVTKKNTKVALRDAAKEVIPNESYKRKKLGFPVPIREWIRDDDIYNDIKDMFESNIANKFFKTKKLIKMLDEHKSKRKDNYRKIWNVYIFLKWYKVFFEGSI